MIGLDPTIEFIEGSPAKYLSLGDRTRRAGPDGAPQPALSYEQRLDLLSSTQKEDLKALVERASRCLATVRRRLLAGERDWTLYDYELVIETLGSRDPSRLLDSLLSAYRVAPAEEQVEPTAVMWQWEITAKAGRIVMAHSPVADSLAQHIAQVVPGAFRDSDQHICDWDGGEKAMRALCVSLSEHCAAKLQLKRKEKSFVHPYVSRQCKEPDPYWRQGHLEALAELGLNPGGRVHRLVKFVEQHDPCPAVRETASALYPVVRAASTANRTAAEWRRAFLAAFWWIRIARTHAAGIEFDQFRAERQRRLDLRHVR